MSPDLQVFRWWENLKSRNLGSHPDNTSSNHPTQILEVLTLVSGTIGLLDF